MHDCRRYDEDDALIWIRILREDYVQERMITAGQE